MPPRSVSPAAALFSLLLCIPLSAQTADTTAASGSEASVETVALRFGWPVGLTADVSSVSRRTQGDQPVQEMSLDYVMEVLEGTGGGIVVRRRDAEITGFRANGAPVDPGTDPMMELVRGFAQLDLDYRVGPTGDFQELVNVDEARVAVGRVVDALMAQVDSLADAGALQGEAGAVVAGLREMMATATSGEALSRDFAEQWGGMVGFWTGADFDLGYSYTMDTEEPSPLVPGLVIPMQIEAGAYERTACHEDAEPDSCVVLEFVSVPDPTVAGPAVEDWLRRVMGDDSDFSLVSMAQENFIQVVAEPGTLIPHSLYTSRTVELTIEVEGAVQGESRVDETEVTFRYRR